MLDSLLRAFGITSPRGDAAMINACIREYAGAEIFRDSNAPYIKDNPFRRALINTRFAALDLDRPLGLDELHSNASLIANRVLLSIYERDFVLLPAADIAGKRQDFEAYYSEQLRVLGELVRPHLERYLFQCVEREVSVTGPWTIDAFLSYFEDYRQRFTAGDNQVLMDAITGARDPVSAAMMYLIQLAGDFLVESSAMTRNVLGNYGPLQSALFKVVIDECGYGVHETKHSTLFQKVLERSGLDAVPHTYWQLYLPSSLYLNNYYNYICKNHASLFRYIGAILQVETAFRVTCRQMAAMMKSVFGPSAEIDYFTEHVHIDEHHSRMVLETLVVPAVKAYGNSVLIDIVRGFEESLVVGQVYTEGLLGHVTWADSFVTQSDSGVRAGHDSDRASPADGAGNGAAKGAWSGTSICDVDTIYQVQSGSLDIVVGYQSSLRVGSSGSARVPRGRLHALVPGPGCVYTEQGVA